MHALKQEGQLSQESRGPQGEIYSPPTPFHTHGNHGDITTPPPASCLGLDNQAWSTSTQPRPELRRPDWPQSGCRKNWDWAIWSVQTSSTAWEDYHRSLHALLPGLGSDGARLASRASRVAPDALCLGANSYCGAVALAAAAVASGTR